MNELALIQSQALRAEHATRVDVLDKVKALSLLPDGVHLDTAGIAEYYEVGVGTIESLARRNREELEGNGMHTLKGAEYREFATVALKITNPMSRSGRYFPRRAILNVGQLLEDSPIAKRVRAYLLNLEEIASVEQRSEAVGMVELAKSRIELLGAAFSYLDEAWVKAKIRIQVAIGLGEEPEIDADDMPLYVPDFLKSKGLTQAQIKSAQSWFGRRVVKVALAEQRPMPAKRAEDTTSGAVRETYAWTRKDLPLFEEVWDMYYAGGYGTDEQADLFAGSDA